MERYRIILVEDDAIIALDSRHRLEKLGHTVVAMVADGEAAIAAVRKTSPDLVLMDIGLAGKMDGIETAAKVRAIKDLPVIFLTAYGDDATLARAKVAEPDGYLLKPSSNREIQITIELAVYRHAMVRERAQLRDRIKRLEGIIPICASCKKIRNDDGYWEQVESYLSERSNLLFSHSICHDCMPIVYPPDEYPYLYDKGSPWGAARSDSENS